MVAVQVGVYDASVTETQQEGGILREMPFFGESKRGMFFVVTDLANAPDWKQESGSSSANLQEAAGDDRLCTLNFSDSDELTALQRVSGESVR